MTIRRLEKKDIPKMKELFHYAFYEPDDWDFDAENWVKFFSVVDFENSLGCFSNDELISTWLVHDYQFYVRGVLMKMGGIAGVATKPEFRRQGNVSKMAKESFKMMREKGQTISVLYPFKYSYYRMFGYENCIENSFVISTPNNIKLPKDFKPLTIKEISRDKSLEIANKFRTTIGRNYNTVMFDLDNIWQFHKFSKNSKFFVIEDEGKIVGYFITNLEKREGPWNVRLNITDVLVDSQKARLTLFDYIKKHTDQNKDFRLVLYGDERVLDYFEELWSENVTFQKHGGAMFRVVDAIRALQLLEFPSDIKESFTLKITDEYAPWNEQPISIEVQNGRAIIKVISTNIFDLELDIKSFTQLFVGYRTIYDLIDNGITKVSNEKIESINYLFPKRTTRIDIDF